MNKDWKEKKREKDESVKKKRMNWKKAKPKESENK